VIFRAIIWFFFFYVVFKAYRFFKKVMQAAPRNESGINSAVSETSKIDKSDIIDAEFEDLPVNENAKETSNED